MKLKKHTTEEFIEKAQKMYGDRYDYSLVKYVNYYTKVKIICSKHGIFEKTYKRFFNNIGCSKCYFESSKLNTVKFIEKAKLKHGNKYDYSLVEYTKNNNYVKIVCPIHGVFEQKAGNHLFGFGCLNCVKNKKMNTKEFIKKAQRVHGETYDYSSVDYIGSHIKIKIICKIHGTFEQSPTNHLSKNGCPICRYLKSAENTRLTNVEFIEKAKLVHGDKFDYSVTKYYNWGTDVEIVCYKHGVFSQAPGNHLAGKGCKYCKESKGELRITNYLDENSFDYIKEKLFDQCRNNRKLPFDFYLPKYNLLIEYDGKQHYESVKYFGGENGLKLRQTNDNIKNEFAKANNINLLRINYNQFKNIITILDEYLKTT